MTYEQIVAAIKEATDCTVPGNDLLPALYLVTTENDIKARDNYSQDEWELEAEQDVAFFQQGSSADIMLSYMLINAGLPPVVPKKTQTYNHSRSGFKLLRQDAQNAINMADECIHRQATMALDKMQARFSDAVDDYDQLLRHAKAQEELVKELKTKLKHIAQSHRNWGKDIDYWLDRH